MNKIYEGTKWDTSLFGETRGVLGFLMEIDEVCCAYSSCVYWHAKECASFLTDSRCRYRFNKAAADRSGRIEFAGGSPYTKRKGQRTNLSFSFPGMDVCHRWDLPGHVYYWRGKTINSSSPLRHISAGKYMALIRKRVGGVCKLNKSRYPVL